MRKTALFLLGLVVVALLALGLVVLSSAAQRNGLRLYDDAYFFFKRQLIYVVGFFIMAVIVALFDYRIFKNHPAFTAFIVLVVFLLLLVVLFSRPINGSRRWIDLGFFMLQPSELAKIVVVIAVAAWLDRCGWRVGLVKNGLVVPMVIIGLFVFPLIREPDFGAVMVVGLLGLLVMWLCGVKFLHLCLVGTAVVLLFGGYLVTNPNRMARIGAWFGKSVDVGLGVSGQAIKGAGYQANQSLVAIKNGGIYGVGLNQSMQKYLYLPEAHTDFIFAIGAEELGLFFSVAVLLLFSAFFGISLYIASKSEDRFGRTVASGMAFLVFFQAIFNIGVVCSALPTKGMALPFFTYGGTNMISLGVVVGLIFSVGLRALNDKRRSLLKRVVLK